MSYALSANDARKYIHAINGFRLTDLQTCLSETQYSPYGRKNELVDRLINLIRHPNPQVNLLTKIRTIATTVYRNQELLPDRVPPHYSSSFGQNSNGQLSMTIGGPNNNISRYTQPMQLNSRSKNPTIIPSLPTHRQPINDNVKRVKSVELPYFKIIRELVPVKLLDPRDRNVKRLDSIAFECQLPYDSAAEIFSYKSNPACQSSMKLPRTEIMLRMFKNDSNEIQIDDYPNDCKVKIGRVMCTLPPLGQPSRVGQTPKRQNRHCDITYPVCEAVAQQGSKWKNNLPTHLVFTVEWEHDPNLFYLFQVTVVRHVTAEALRQEFLQRIPKPLEFTRSKIITHIKGMCDNDDEVQTEQSIPIQLKCPMTLVPIVYPARGDLCDHFSCFDMKTWLDSNEKRPTCKCPLCGKRVNFSKVEREQYFIDMLSVCPPEATQAKLLPNGNWIAYDDNDKRVCASNPDGSVDGMTKMSNALNANAIQSPIKVDPISISNGALKRPAEEIVLLSDDDDDNENSTNAPPPAKQAVNATLRQNDIIVLADDDTQQHPTTSTANSAAPAIANVVMSSSAKILQPIRPQQQQPTGAVLQKATPPQQMKWKQKILDNGKRIMELDGRMPSQHLVKLVLDSPDFLNISMVKHMVQRCPKEHLYRVLFAYAQVLSVADQVGGPSGRDHTCVSWPGKIDLYKDPSFPNFPSKASGKDTPYYSELCVAYVGNINSTNALEIFVSASAQSKEYPDIVMVTPHPDFTNCGYVTKLDKLTQDPPIWVISTIKKRIESEKKTAQQAKQAKQQQQQQANAFRSAHATQQAATARPPQMQQPNAMVSAAAAYLAATSGVGYTTSAFSMPTNSTVYTATMGQPINQTTGMATQQHWQY